MMHNISKRFINVLESRRIIVIIHVYGHVYIYIFYSHN
jgi:hypothetical protein